MNHYANTMSLCPVCARDIPACYQEQETGMFFYMECPLHGTFHEPVERDPAFFKQGYEWTYEKPSSHLVLPLTYRCNLSCNYCYSMSNGKEAFIIPQDRSFAKIAGFIKDFDGNITLIGGEPTLRPDLFDIIRFVKDTKPSCRVSLGTNGQKLHDYSFVKQLKDAGLDFVFLSFNDSSYDNSDIIIRNKRAALNHCLALRVPVWLQRTIDSLSQIDSLFSVLEQYRKIIFNVTLRAVRCFGLTYPKNLLSLSEIVHYIGGDTACQRGTLPFNRYVYFKRIPVKVCSWILDVARVDPLDSHYIISTDALTTFHRGMKMDEIVLKQRNQAFIDEQAIEPSNI